MAWWRLASGIGAALPLVVFACAAPAPAPRVRETVIPADRELPSTVTTATDEGKPDAFEPTSGPGDVPVQYVRDERSSRLDVAMPAGTAREAWRAPIGGTRRVPCAEGCSAGEATYLLAAGNRVAVAGAGAWALFDTSGRRVDAGPIASGAVRIDRASGAIVADDRAGDAPPGAKVAWRSGAPAMVKDGGVFLGERELEGKFEALDLAIDDAGLVCVAVRQVTAKSSELALWTMPLWGGGSVGRYRVDKGAARRLVGPPIVSRAMRVLPLETGLVALGLDGKRLWERRGSPTGGATMTADEIVLVADENKVVAVDRRGRTTEVYAARDVVFVSPPIVNAGGLLFVASGASLHAVAFGHPPAP